MVVTDVHGSTSVKGYSQKIHEGNNLELRFGAPQFAVRSPQLVHSNTRCKTKHVSFKIWFCYYTVRLRQVDAVVFCKFHFLCFGKQTRRLTFKHS